MKKTISFLFAILFFHVCIGQVVIHKEDGSIIEGNSLKIKKGIIDYGTGTITATEVLYLKYKNNFYTVQERTQALIRLKKNFNPELQDSQTLGTIYAYKYFKCKCTPETIDDNFKRLASDRLFLGSYNYTTKTLKQNTTLGYIGGCIGGVVLYFVIQFAVSSMI